MMEIKIRFCKIAGVRSTSFANYVTPVPISLKDTRGVESKSHITHLIDKRNRFVLGDFKRHMES